MLISTVNYVTALLFYFLNRFSTWQGRTLVLSQKNQLSNMQWTVGLTEIQLEHKFQIQLIVSNIFMAFEELYLAYNFLLCNTYRLYTIVHIYIYTQET